MLFGKLPIFFIYAHPLPLPILFREYTPIRLEIYESVVSGKAFALFYIEK